MVRVEEASRRRCPSRARSLIILPFCADEIGFDSLYTSAFFALTTCYTNQLLMIQSHSNKWNSIRSRRLLELSPNKLLGCIGMSHSVARVSGVDIRITPFFSFRYLIESTGYFGISPLLSSSNLPSNDTTRGLAEGLAGAHRAYGVPECVLLKFLQTSRALIQPRVFAVHTYFSSSSPMSGTYSINAC